MLGFFSKKHGDFVGFMTDLCQLNGFITLAKWVCGRPGRYI